MDSTPLIGFGPFQLDVRRRQFLKGDHRIHITAKTFDLLLYLAHNNGRVVDKDELMSAVWPDSPVEESNLTVTMSMLRRALDRFEANHGYIVTIPKRGYRFTPSVSGLDVSASAAVFGDESARPARAVRHARLSIALLRLRTTGPECAEALAEGVVSSVLCHLIRERVPILQVHEREHEDAVAAAHRIGARAALEGTLEQASGQIRARLKLVRVRDRLVLWAEQFDERQDDPLAIEDALGHRVASALVTWLRTDAPIGAPPRDGRISAAAQAYRKGLYLFEKRTEASLRRGIKYFEEATTRDPKYAAAHLGLGDSYFLLCYYGMLPPKVGYPKTRHAALRALDLAPGLGLAHTTLGCVRLFYEWDAQQAEPAFTKGIELCPNEPRAHHWYSDYLRAVGRFDDAVAAMQRARERDPLSMMVNTSMALVYFYARRTEAAIAELHRVLEMDPYFAVAHWVLGLAHQQQGRHNDAIRALHKAVTLSKRNSLMLGTLGYAYGAAGRHVEATRVLRELQQLSRTQFVSAYSVALIYVGLDDKSRAMVWLRKARAERAGWLTYIHVNPMLDRLRSDARFQALAHRIPLTAAAPASIRNI
jgi:DNA-binding winged helix-turn-helix (wHTH) protein/tetratricopeptide (TPR) repeat protein